MYSLKQRMYSSVCSQIMLPVRVTGVNPGANRLQPRRNSPALCTYGLGAEQERLTLATTKGPSHIQHNSSGEHTAGEINQDS